MGTAVLGAADEKLLGGDHVAAGVSACSIEVGSGHLVEFGEYLRMGGFDLFEQVGHGFVGLFLHRTAVEAGEVEVVGHGDFSGDAAGDLADVAAFGYGEVGEHVFGCPLRAFVGGHGLLPLFGCEAVKDSHAGGVVNGDAVADSIFA